MVYKCFVYGCKTHKTPKKTIPGDHDFDNSQYTTFGIPKDPELLWQWEVALRPYSNGKELRSKHRVCKAHFRPEEIELYFTHLIQGTEVKITRGRPVLKKGAVPSIFPGQKKPPRRILNYKNGEKDKKIPTVVLLNGKWVHLDQCEVPAEPNRKRNSKRKFSKSPATTTELENSCPPSAGLKQKKSTGNSNEITDQTQTFGPYESTECVAQPIPGLSPVKPPDKEMSSRCVNWDALPLPEEIGSLLYDNLLPPVSFSSDFHFQPSKNVSPSSPKSSSVPASLSLTDPTTEQPPEEHLSPTDYLSESPPEEEENSIVSFQGLLLNLAQIHVPSQMWGVHTDENRVYFSFMSYTGCIAIPRVEKIVMYQSCMIPRVFLRGTEVVVPASEKKSTTVEEVEEVLNQVDSLKLCLGIDSAGDVVSYSSDCKVFVESGRLPRCPTCRKERLVECTKKRHLESDPRPPKKKPASAK